MPGESSGRRGRIAVPCDTCGEHFWVIPSASVRKYCSRRCYRLRELQPVAERFWAKVDTSGDCWVWTAARNGFGYGKFSVGRGHDVPAYRWAYRFLVGPVPRGYLLDHLCRNRLCVRPDHLEPVTHAENIRRGWQARPKVKVERTHCKHGHPYDDANTYLDPRTGGRGCRACGRERRAAWRAAQPPRVPTPRPARTHCPKGHPYDERNTYVNKKGVKVCRACRALAQRPINARRSSSPRSRSNTAGPSATGTTAASG